MSRPLPWREHTGLRAVDIALADTLRRRDQIDGIAPDERVLLAASLASLAIAHGHAAFDPAQPGLLLDDVSDVPDAVAWRDALMASRWVATPDRDTAADPAAPLVFEGGLLYLRRYREYERRLAQGLQRIAAQSPAAANLASLASIFASLFPEAQTGDQQATAAALALQQSLLLITGGPGTGKTATIARLLLLLLAQAQHAGTASPRIALAAPTGRAAERMAQSLRVAATQLRAAGIGAMLRDALPTDASTLHRLLGTIIDNPWFRHNADNPLPYDVIVVDEASMVDLPLMCKLVEAVPAGARLILLGDRDQLPSVEAGDVLAAIIDAAGDDEALPAEIARALQPLLGPVPASATAAHGLAGHRVQLHRGYRVSAALDLDPLAAAMRDGDTDRALALLRGAALRGVHFHDGVLDPLASTTREALLTPWRALVDVDDPASALALANRVRLLTALREGPQGAHALNARIEEALAGAHRAPYFHGRLLLVTENSYRHGLFNGDIGVCLRPEGSPLGGRGDDGASVAWFAGSDGPRAFHPAALPAHTGAFAMTVHKAQGSEFEEVWLQLPRHDARTLSRELLYTAITRARSTLHVCANEDALRAALARHAMRVSGLAARLAYD